MILFQVGVIVSRASGALLVIMSVCSLFSMLPVMDIMSGGWGSSLGSSSGSGHLHDTYYFISSFSVMALPLGTQIVCGLFLIFGSRITARWLTKGMEEPGEIGTDRGL